jgi:hypothetical protein
MGSRESTSSTRNQAQYTHTYIHTEPPLCLDVHASITINIDSASSMFFFIARGRGRRNQQPRCRTVQLQPPDALQGLTMTLFLRTAALAYEIDISGLCRSVRSVQESRS